MDEMSWRARLLKSNINITHIDWDKGLIFCDFAWRPYGGANPRWGKTFVHCIAHYPGVDTEVDWNTTSDLIRKEILALRKELEG